MKFTLESVVVNHIVGYVFFGTAPIDAPLQFEAPLFRSYWGERDELHIDNRFKGHPEIYALLEQTPPDQLFFAEHEFTSDF